MADERARRRRVGRALALHLEELERDGVWGLSVTPADGGPAAEDRPRDPETDRARERMAPPDTGGDDGSAPEVAPADAEHGDRAATAGPARPADLFADAGGGPLADRGESLEDIEPEVADCTLCRLCESRTNTVFGTGDPAAELMFIGEGPGRDEDRQGEPFVGRAGGLLDRIIGAMERRREEVYIANTVKCRPPQNRNPRPDELDACRPYLLRQVAVIRPRVIVLLGRVAVESVLGLDAPLSRLRGRFHDWHGTDVMCTYHPAYLLRNPSAKRMVWEDMQMVMRRLAGEE